MTALSIVPATDAELPFLREMLYEAAFWRGRAAAGYGYVDELTPELSIADGAATMVRPLR